jgi:hypothetical protein
VALTVHRHLSGSRYNSVPLPPGAKYIGTVIRDGTDAGALVMLPSGIYMQVNRGAMRSLPQRAVREALEKAVAS